jgi:hypothetical protein
MLLRRINPDFADWLHERSAWIHDGKRFRDPSAHRLPFAIVRGIMTDEEGQRNQELSKQSWNALLNDQWEESERLQSEADALGRFVPLLDGPRGPDEGIYIVPKANGSGSTSLPRARACFPSAPHAPPPNESR